MKKTNPKAQMPKQPGVQMFTIAFDTEKQSLSFIGNISAEQAEELIKIIIQQKQEGVIRERVKSELAQEEKARTQVEKGKVE